MSTLNVTNIAAADGTSSLSIANSTGFIDLKKQQIPMFSVYRSTAQNINQNAWTKVVWNAEYTDGDPDNAFDTTNGRYVAPVKGWYHLSFLCSMDVSGGDSGHLNYSSMNKNGTQLNYQEFYSTASHRHTHSFLMNMAVGDYCEVSCYNTSANVNNIRGGVNESQFHGFLVRALA